MKLLVANHSHYPRIGESPEHQALRKVRAAFDKGRAGPDELEEAARRASRAAIADQIAAGADLVTDGLVRWDDPITHLLARMSGVRFGRLVRYFDSDFFYRRPEPAGAVRRRGVVAADDYEWARGASDRPVKAVLTGPVTLAAACAVKGARERASLRRDLTAALAAEVKELRALGAPWIQIDEPAVADADGVEAAARSLEDFRGRGPSRIVLALSFFPVAPLYRALCRLPADALALDFCSGGDALVEAVARHGAPKPLGLGLVDGREARLEKIPELLDRLERLRPALEGKDHFLMPSCGLEFLPRDRAAQKLARLREARDHFAARLASEAAPFTAPYPGGKTDKESA